MKNTVLWVVGEPGAGKTTLVRTLLDPSPRLIAKPKWTVGSTVVAAGHYSGAAFDGADTVPYNGVKASLDFWREMLAREAALTVFDGDRFSNATTRAFFSSYISQPQQLCALVTVPEGEGMVRRSVRALDAGTSLQNAAWVKGRITKSRRFFEGFDEESRIELEGSSSVEELSEWLHAFLGKTRTAVGKV